MKDTAPARARTTRTTELTTTRSLTLGDLGAFVRECEGEGWTPDASVTFHQQHGDRPGELSTYSLRVSETR
ncbi:hypothetical protein SEA_RUTHY_51 [Gordonia phage Ruthy]|uniref:Uncharacterized protein n=1 Tax=Gordonia phage Ruthy TaxID=2250323 RepID=A0A345L5G2_9CAUD|nr:hypothetical protein HOT73_gp51 [Gordonia phage Ruthy]AXH50514.1 hypothetical protein SEA_RUTHY_51 [Gordonia phage Ruthy]